MSSSNGNEPTGKASEIPLKCKQLISQSFCPMIAVTASSDTEELCENLGVSTFLDLIKPFGDKISGRVTIRDSQSLSVSFDDFAVRFSKPPSETSAQIDVPEISLPSSPVLLKSPNHNKFSPSMSTENNGNSLSSAAPNSNKGSNNIIPHQLFNIQTVEDMLSHELEKGQEEGKDMATTKDQMYINFIKGLLIDPPVVPYETFSHPVAGLIAISSKNQEPIETLSNLYKQSHDPSIADYINKDYLRYYVLIHDDQNDDLSKSVALFEKMKRNFGLHCHMIRINRSREGEDVNLAEIKTATGNTVSLNEEDINALSLFTRELITQSVIPFMERSIATWNDQVASSRRGLTGRFFSASKKYFSSSSSKATSSILSSANTGSFPFSLPGTPSGPSPSPSPSPTQSSTNNSNNSRGTSSGGIIYTYLTPEAQLRKLADFAFMLRDYKFAYTTYDMLKRDFHNEKAWTYLAGVQEMAAISYLMHTASSTTTTTENSYYSNIRPSQKSGAPSADILEPLLDSATYTYISRCSLPTYALRCIVLCSELLCTTNSLSAASDMATRWILKALNEKLVGRLAYATLMERVSGAYNMYDQIVLERSKTRNPFLSTRRRKAAFWMLLAGREWTDAAQYPRSEYCLDQADLVYSNYTWASSDSGLLSRLRSANQERKGDGNAEEGDSLTERSEVESINMEGLKITTT